MLHCRMCCDCSQFTVLVADRIFTTLGRLLFSFRSFLFLLYIFFRFLFLGYLVVFRFCCWLTSNRNACHNVAVAVVFSECSLQMLQIMLKV